METVVDDLIAVDDKDVSSKGSVIEFLDDTMSILSFNLKKSKKDKKNKI